MRSEFLISRVENARDLPLPEYMSESSAGMDLFANVSKNVIIEPREYSLIPTGIRISLPQGYEAQIRPRSGLALKHGITLLNTPGTVDADYRGEICVLLVNFGQENFVVQRGMRIAQMVINKIEKICFEETDELDATKRGDGGFGHTG